MDDNIVDLDGVIGPHLSQMPHYLDLGDQLPRFVGGVKDMFEELYSHHRLSGLLARPHNLPEAAYADHSFDYVVLLYRGPNFAYFFHYSGLVCVFLDYQYLGVPHLFNL